jgi:fucose permease
MSHCVLKNLGWQMGYRSVSLIQIALTVVLFCSLPLWKKKKAPAEERKVAPSLSLAEVLALPRAKYALLAFFFYCVAEATAGLWASTYMVEFRGVAPSIAARFGALFYLGLTAGRFLSGLIADCLGDRRMVRLGIFFMLAGVGLMLFPMNVFALFGLVVMGLAPRRSFPA